MHPYRAEAADDQRERLATIRTERDDDAVATRLAEVRRAAEAGANVMPAVIDAVEVYASVGEVCGTLREVYGCYQEPVR
jgi:methylmalonyl-CoA mutase N-terminal domain/subunit